MSLEQAIEEIKKMFWGVLKGTYSPDEEEDIKAHLITNLATLTSYAKTCLPSEQQSQYENHFKKAKNALLKFDSAGPWFRELPEMIDAVYNIITYANMLQIECRRFSGTEENLLEYYKAKIENLELTLISLQEELKKLKKIKDTPKIELLPSPVVSEEPMQISDTQTEEIPETIDLDVSETEDNSKTIDELEELQAFTDLEELQLIEEEQIPKPEIIRDEILEMKEEDKLTSEAKDLIEGIELASQYEFEHEPFVQNIETEQEALKKLANLLSALDSGEDAIISPLTEKLLSLGEDEVLEMDVERPLIEEGLSEEEIAEVQEFQESVSRLSSVLSSQEVEDAAEFVTSIKQTIASVTLDKELEEGEKSKLTRIIEEETGEVAEKPPVQSDDIQNIIKHLESRRQKALERIQQLETALNSDKIDEEEWHELRIKAEQHMLRIEDTLDGYKRFYTKIQSQE